MSKKKIIDVHSHLFFLDYVLKEFFELVKAIENGTYPVDWDLVTNLLKGLQADSDFTERLEEEENDFFSNFDLIFSGVTGFVGEYAENPLSILTDAVDFLGGGEGAALS